MQHDAMHLHYSYLHNSIHNQQSGNNNNPLKFPPTLTTNRNLQQQLPFIFSRRCHCGGAISSGSGGGASSTAVGMAMDGTTSSPSGNRGMNFHSSSNSGNGHNSNAVQQPTRPAQPEAKAEATAQTAQEFYLFPLLPKELQLKIWTHATFQEPRIITIQAKPRPFREEVYAYASARFLNGSSASGSSSTSSSRPSTGESSGAAKERVIKQTFRRDYIPTLLHVCATSRLTALHHLTLIQSRPSSTNSHHHHYHRSSKPTEEEEQDASKPIPSFSFYINFAIDVLNIHIRLQQDSDSTSPEIARFGYHIEVAKCLAMLFEDVLLPSSVGGSGGERGGRRSAETSPTRMRNCASGAGAEVGNGRGFGGMGFGMGVSGRAREVPILASMRGHRLPPSWSTTSSAKSPIHNHLRYIALNWPLEMLGVSAILDYLFSQVPGLEEVLFVQRFERPGFASGSVPGSSTATTRPGRGAAAGTGIGMDWAGAGFRDLEGGEYARSWLETTRRDLALAMALRDLKKKKTMMNGEGDDDGKRKRNVRVVELERPDRAGRCI